MSTHFTPWCLASNVNDFDSLCDMIVIEQFKNSLPVRIVTYVSAFTDVYVLMHGGVSESPGLEMVAR